MVAVPPIAVGPVTVRLVPGTPAEAIPRQEHLSTFARTGNNIKEFAREARVSFPVMRAGRFGTKTDAVEGRAGRRPADENCAARPPDWRQRNLFWTRKPPRCSRALAKSSMWRATRWAHARLRQDLPLLGRKVRLRCRPGSCSNRPQPGGRAGLGRDRFVRREKGPRFETHRERRASRLG